MSIFPSSFISIQASHDAAMFARHAAGSDVATVVIAGIITCQALVDSDDDTVRFDRVGQIAKTTKMIHVLGSSLGNYIFGQDFNIGDGVSINGDEAWQIETVTQSPDNGNMVDVALISRNV